LRTIHYEALEIDIFYLAFFFDKSYKGKPHEDL
jgi:hypothetical protein